jgi:integrase
MSVFKDKNKWRAVIHLDGVRIKSKGGFETQSEAQDWHDTEFDRLTKKKADGETIEQERKKPGAKTILFDELWERFEIVHLPTIRTATKVRYELDFKYRIQPHFQGMELSKITQITVEDFKVEMLKKISIKSMNNCLAVLKLLLKRAVEWGMLKENPGQHVRLQKLPEQKYSWWQDKSDIAKFLAAAKLDRHYLAYRLALDCGLRLGEIIGLSKKDVNLSLCQIHIHRQWLEKEKIYGPTKHGRERYIGFSKDSELYQLLEKAIKTNPENEIIFLTLSGKRLSCRKLSGCYFQKLIKKSGVPKIRFHDLRHTFASWFMIATDNIWDLKYLLGHADVQTTQRYAHLSSKQKFTPDFRWESEKE